MEVYLPSGNKWYNYWTNEDFDGGQKLKIKTSLDRIPLFVRAGSIIPIGPDVQYTNEKKWDNLIINVYPGADGTFTLYEDEGDNYNYESGAYTEIQMKWNDTKRILTIDARKGEYNGMLTKRNFTIRTADGKEKIITYSGKKINVKI